MAWPFSRLKTYLANGTPKLQAADLNLMQDGIAAAAWPSYSRMKYEAACVTGLAVNVGSIEAYMALDSATSQYVGMPALTGITTVSSGFTDNAWNYIYLRVTNGTVAFSVSTTGPDTSRRWKTGDETYRYLCCAYMSSSILPYFTVRDGRYNYDSRVQHLSSTAATFWTTFTASTTIPPTGIRTTLLVQVKTGTQIFYLRPTSSGIGTPRYCYQGHSTTITIGVNASQQYDYGFAAGGCTADVFIEGFEE